MATPQLINYSFSSSGTVQIPSGSEGNLAVAFISTVDGASGTVSATGWTQKLVQDGGGSGQRMYVLSKTLTADEAANGPFVTFNSGSGVQAVILLFSGVMGIEYLIGAAVVNSSQASAPSGTTASANALVVNVWALAAAGFASVPQTALPYNGGGAGSQSAAYRTQANAGPSTTVTATTTNASNWAVVSMAFTNSVAPAAPTLTSPAPNSAVDAAGVVNLTAKYNSRDQQPANAYQLRIKTSTGSYKYWNAGTGALQATAVWNSLSPSVADGGAITVPISAGVLANAATYNWSMATQEAGGNLQGPYADDATFTAQAAPSVTNVTPSGAVQMTQPTTTWSSTTPAGPQTSYRVIWETGNYGATPGSGTQVADTGIVNSAATSVMCPVALSNNASYRVFVIITQSKGQSSTPTYSTFTINLPGPVTPTITATPGVNSTSSMPQINIGVQGGDGTNTGANYSSANTTFQVQRSYDSGTTWQTIRFGNLTPSSTTDAAATFDAETPFGQSAIYRARTIGAVANNGLIPSNWSAPTSAVKVVSTLYWLHSPASPGTAVAFELTKQDPRTRNRDEDVVTVLGSAATVVEYDVRQYATSAFAWLVRNPAELATLQNLLDADLLMQRTPAERAWPGDGVFFQCTGPRVITRLGNDSPGRVVNSNIVERSGT